MADMLFDEMIKRALQADPSLAQAVDPPAQTPKREGAGRLATLMYLAGLGADAATTTYGSLSGKTEEANPLMKWAGKGAGPAVGAIGVGGMLLAKKLLGKNHPKILKGFLMGMGGVHGAAALNNMNQMRQGKVNSEQAMPGRDPNEPPFPGAVRLPDGSWINPDLFN
jgi:hypothetical protein